MTNAFSSMEYPHWLIVAGALLLMLGFVGLALRQRGVEAEIIEMASGHEQGLKWTPDPGPWIAKVKV